MHGFLILAAATFPLWVQLSIELVRWVKGQITR